MDLAKTLIRSVVRAFYETRHVLVIDALMIHSALPNEDLALLLGMQQKDLRKLCGRLREDRLMAVHSRQETREGQQRPVNKDYYYIDFHATIDAIKYRIFQLTNQVKDLYKPSEEKKDYYCPRCHSKWTQYEVLSNISEGNNEFLCERCDGVLERDDISAADMAGHERQSRLMVQLGKLLKLMPLIDSEDIPHNDFEMAFSLAIPIQRNEDVNPTRKMEAVDTGRGAPTAVKGLTQVVAAPLEISLTTSSERTAAEKAAEAKRKAELGAQNALPKWHTESTVTGEITALGNKERERLANGGATPTILKEEEEEKKDGNLLNDELAAYYAQMAQEKEKEAREDREGDENSSEEEEDEEDEFEDVGGIGASSMATPSSSMSTPFNGSQTATAAPSFTYGNGNSNSNSNGYGNGNGIPSKSSLKRESDSGSSGPNTTTSTPAASGTAVDLDGSVRDGQSPAKRIKLDPGAIDISNSTDAGFTGKTEEKESDEDDEDDDAEFEDAL